jgi:hypothetical protein
METPTIFMKVPTVSMRVSTVSDMNSEDTKSKDF